MTAKVKAKDSVNPFERKWQADLDAELTLVGAAVDHPDQAAVVLHVVQPEEFGDRVCSKVWAAVQRLIRSGSRVDLDAIIREVKPEDVLGPDGCHEPTVADCIRETVNAGSGTAIEVLWCALRIRAQARRNALLDVLERFTRAVVGAQIDEAKTLLETASRLLADYDRAHVEAMQELKRLQTSWSQAQPPS